MEEGSTQPRGLIFHWNLGALLYALSEAHKPLSGQKVTPRQPFWGKGEEMDPKRFMTQMLKFPGLEFFSPSNF